MDKSDPNQNLDRLDPVVLSQQATQAGDRIKYLHDVQKWNSEASGKLYYPLWILFMGGFVLSLAPPDRTNTLATHTILIHTFRLLAILGTVFNFIMQSVAINSTFLTGHLITSLDRYRDEMSKGNVAGAEFELKHGEGFHRQREQFNLAVMILRICAEACAVAFLVLALIGTWNLLPVDTPK